LIEADITKHLVGTGHLVGKRGVLRGTMVPQRYHIEL